MMNGCLEIVHPAVFQSYRDDDRVIMKGSVQSSAF